jgi:transposase
MANIRRRYNKQEKLEIVNESMESNIDFDTLATRYNLHPNTIRRWQREFTSDPETAFPGNGN